MRQSGSVPQAWTSHCPGLKPVTPFRIIFWYFPRETQSGGHGNVKVCPSADGVWAADGPGTAAVMIRSETASESTPLIGCASFSVAGYPIRAMATLEALKAELERFGEDNDALHTERRRRM